ncbi:MAG: nucleotide pyrophosphohydrolase [Longicatena sp.]
MKKVIDEIRTFNELRDWDQFHEPVHLAKSIVIEAAELLECFQWDNNEYDKKHVCEELADVMNYCVLLADKLNVDIEEIILDKLKQNEAKYPVEKSKGKSNKYDEL